MTKREEYIQKCKDLNQGESYFINMGEEQGGEIMKGCDYKYLLYEVTWDGWIFEGHYMDVEEAVDIILGWT